MGHTDIAQFLSVDQPVIIRTQPGTAISTRFRSVIRGWRTGVYIIFDLPSEESMLSHLHVHQNCVVEFLHDGRVCGFLAMLTDCGDSSHRQFKTAWPHETQIVELRRHQRAKLHAACTVELPDGSNIEGDLLDLSAGGCRVAIEEAPEKGAVCRLSFSLDSGLSFQELPMVVRNVTGGRKRRVIGCQFQGLTERTMYDIEFLVATTLERTRGAECERRYALLLDHDHESLTRIRGLLEDMGYEVSAAPSLVDAFYRIRLRKPCGVVVRVDYPELPGCDVSRILKSTQGCEDVSIVLLGGSEPLSPEAVSACGACAWAESPEDILSALGYEMCEEQIEAV